MKNVIFIAPPSAGKGTQSGILKERYGFEHISTGDLLRNVDPTTELGKEIRELINNGILVSDELITKLIKDKLLEVEGNFILDGYPRNLTQAEILDNLLNEINKSDYIVVYLNIDEDMAMKRALGRINCSSCKAIYNTYYEEMKPKVEGICDKCGTALDIRDDDNEEGFKKRFQVFMQNTLPLIDYYKEKGLLKEVEVHEEKEETFERVLKAISGE